MSFSLNKELIGKKLYGKTIAVHAKHRKGKTLTVVALVVWYLTTLKHFKGVISNVALDLSSVGLKNKYRPLVDLKNLKREEYKDWIILTDEFRRLCDSRMSSAFKNIFISNILADTGKFRQVHLLTDQDSHAVDRRIRLNTDWVLVPEMNMKKDITKVYAFEGYQQYWAIVGRGRLRSWKNYYYFKSSDYFKYYDTEQPIEDYQLTFEPQDTLDDFFKWAREEEFIDSPHFQVDVPTLRLWKEMTGQLLTIGQLQSVAKYVKLKEIKIPK